MWVGLGQGVIIGDSAEARFLTHQPRQGGFTVQLSVTGRHLAVTDPMKQYAEEKAGKLTRFYDRIHTIDVILDHEKTVHHVEMVVRTDHKHTFVAKTDAGDFYEAIDLVVDKLSRQLREHKDKLRNRKHPTEG